MKREFTPPRTGWRARLAEIDYHIANHPDGRPYWREDHCYILEEREVEMFHNAALEAQRMVDAALRRAFNEGQLPLLGLPPPMARLGLSSWAAREPSLYGRMDFAWDGEHEPILLEYNADTPTALYEAAVVQWRWLVDRDANADQYNSIQEKLIERWPACGAGASQIHVASLRGVDEELLTSEYIRECANAANVKTKPLDLSEIGWTGDVFVDAEGETIEAMFKLYPSEWMAAETFGAHLKPGRPRLIEPPWRLAASSKALLALMWEMFPNAPNLTPAFFEKPRAIEDFVIKPIFGREGAGVRFGSRTAPNPAAFEDEPVVYQQRVKAKRFSGYTPVFGIWLIGGEPCGLGVREDEAEITGPNACFVPHRIA